MACLAVGFSSLAPQLAFDRQAIMGGEIWRLWTGHLTHFSSHHLMLDVGMLLLVGWLAERQWGTRFTGVAMLLGMPVISIGLLLAAPNLIQYRGISGVAMLMAVAAATALWARQPGARLGLSMLGLALAAKTLLDALGMLKALSSLPVDVSIAWQAHILGGAIGWLAARYRLHHTVQAAGPGLHAPDARDDPHACLK